MRTLSNGIPVLFTRIPGANRYALFLGVHAGSAYEDQTVQGIAHLTEHMLFTTNENFTSEGFVRMLEWHGIDSNASTSHDMIKVVFHGPTKHFGYGAKILATMAGSHQYTNKEFLKEKNIVLEELKSYRNLPAEYLSTWILEPKLLHGSALANNILGSEKTLHAITFDDVVRWKKERFVSDNFVISVAADMDEDSAFAQLEVSFGIFPRIIALAKPPVHNPSPEFGVHKGTRSGIDQAFIHRGYRAPTVADKQFPAMILLKYILDGGMSSRCFQELREKRSLGYAAGFQYSKENGFCYFFIDGCIPERVPDAQEAFDSIIASLDNIPEEEYEGMKTLLLTHIEDKLRSEEDVASRNIDTFVYDSPYTYEALRQAIQTTTAAQVQRTAKSVFGQHVEAILMPPNEQES